MAKAIESADNRIIVSGSYTRNQPNLTVSMVKDYLGIYEYILEVKFSIPQKIRFERAIREYWLLNKQEDIAQFLSDLKYSGKHEQLLDFKTTSQKTVVEAFRRDRKDSVACIMVEAFDIAHPSKSSSTKAMNYSDLVGTWKRRDGLIGQRSYGQTAGVSYTESETIEILPGGRFNHTKVHSHYSGGCEEMTGMNQSGLVSVDGTKLIFQPDTGSEMTKNSCIPSMNRKVILTPKTDTWLWSIRLGEGTGNAISLCLISGKSTAVCFEKTQY